MENGQITTKQDFADALKAALGPMNEQIAELRKANEDQGKKLLESEAKATVTQNFARLFSGINGGQKGSDGQPAELGRAFARGIQCLILAKQDRTKALEVAKKRYGKGADDVVAWLEGGEESNAGFKVKALGSNDFDAGGALAPGGRTNEIIELLRPASVVRSLNPTVVPLDMGTLPIPRLSGGATATYTGENDARRTTQQTTNEVNLSARELGCIVVVSNKLLEVASVDVDNMIRADSIAAIAQKEDETFLISDGTQNKPRGMRYWAASANVSSTAYANTLDGVNTAIQTALLALLNNNVRMLRPGWVFTPSQEVRLRFMRDSNGHYVFREEMATGNFIGFPFRRTTQMTASNFAFADFADWMIGQMSTITVDASNTAAYNDSAGTVQAAFSRNQTVVRLIEQHDCGARHDESIFWATNAAWVPA